jgi:uncharacterized protein
MMRIFDVLSLILLLIGGLNWGLVGFFNVDIVGILFGHMSIVTRVIYCLVGLGAVYEILALRFIQRRWHIGEMAYEETPPPRPSM